MTQFFVEPVKIVLRDTDILVSPLKVKHVSKAAKLVAPLLDSFSNGVDPKAVLENIDAVVPLLALATDQSEEFLGELNLAELVALLTTALSVNLDFFSQTIMPQVNQLVETVQTSTKQVKLEPKQKLEKIGKAA
jgi:hypothetical protein